MKPDYQTFIISIDGQEFIEKLNHFRIPAKAEQFGERIIIKMENRCYNAYCELVSKGLINVDDVQHYSNF
jgi:hypothetical protein